ncbi:unnamed protein product [Somion occarium]|uniref:Uncharacterized protein n=1 Tax=Somion occarium TaxID=3059160 RepID=A0ABP1E786_9APHY
MDFTTHDLRIRTLTTFLHRLNFSAAPRYAFPGFTSNDRVTRKMFDRIATLLRFSTKYETIAVTGGITPSGLHIVVVTESSGPTLKVEKVERRETRGPSLAELASTPFNPHKDSTSLSDHASYVLAALAAYDQSPERDWELLKFIVRRCSLKLHQRLHTDTKVWTQSVADTLVNWSPNARESVKSTWISVGDMYWVIDREPSIPRRTGIDGQVEAQFSDESLKGWACVLANILASLKQHLCNALELAKVGPSTGECVTAFNRAAAYYVILRGLLNKDVLVKTLLTKTSLRTKFNRRAREGRIDDDGLDEDELELTPASGETSEGHVVYRHIEAVAAWAEAGVLLGRSNILSNMAAVEVLIIHIPRPNKRLLHPDEFIAYLRKSSWLAPYEDVLKGVVNNHFPPDKRAFEGAIHAEAILMGVLSEYASDPSSNEDQRVDVQVKFLQENITLLSTRTIGIGRKCWTHGKVLEWSPPRLGIPIEKLIELENALVREVRKSLDGLGLNPYLRQSCARGVLNEKGTSSIHEVYIPHALTAWRNLSIFCYSRF